MHIKPYLIIFLIFKIASRFHNYNARWIKMSINAVCIIMNQNVNKL